MKIISFAGDNSFIDEGLYLSKYYYYQQKNPSCFYHEFSKTSQRWNLTDLEAEVIKNTDDPKDKEKNTYVLISRIKLLQRTVGGFSSYYEETKSNLQLASLIINETDTYFKDYIFLTHKMITNALKGNEKIDQSTICSFYFYHLNQMNISIDQFGAMLVDILNLNKQNSFQKNIIHYIIVDCIQQISSKSSKNIYTQIFENKIVINVIEILCYQLEDSSLIEKTALYLSEIPYNQKIQHISILLKISSALKEEKQSIEERNFKKNQKQQKHVFQYDSSLNNQQYSNCQQTMTIIQSNKMEQLSQYDQNSNASQLFTVTSPQFNQNSNQKNSNYSKKQSKRSKTKKRISNTQQELDKQMQQDDQFEEVNEFTQNNNNINGDQENYFDNKENVFEENYIQQAPQNSFIQQQYPLKKIKEEDQFYRLCEDYQELDIKEVGGIQVMMAYKIFNQIQDLKNIYFNNKLNYREIIKDLEKQKSNSVMSDNSGLAQRKNIQNDLIDQDLLNIFIIQNEICELINEQEINRQEIRCQNLFYIFTFFLSMIEDQDNIYFNYKRNRRRGFNSGYQVISVQIKLLVEDMFKYHRYQNIDKIDSKSSKGRSFRTLPENKQKMEEIRNFQMSYIIKCSIALFKNNLDVHVSQDLVDTIVENLGIEDLDLIHTLILAFAQQENIDLDKKLSIVADRSVELFISMHNYQNDCQNIKESQRLTSSVQKEQKATSELQKLMKTLECTCIINLIYLNHASIDQKLRNSHTVQCLSKKINEYKECVLKNQIDSQQLYVQIMMETVCKYMFIKKRKSQQQLRKLNIQGVFEEIGNNFSQILCWNEKNLLEQLGFFIQYMEFSDFCITQMQRDKNEFGTEESIEMQKNLNIIRRMTVKNLESFHNVDSLDVSNEKGFNKVLIQVLTKIVQIINTKFNVQKSLLSVSFKTMNLKLTLINKIICLILENKLKDSASIANLTAIQVLYESSTYYNQILLMLLEINEDVQYILQYKSGVNEQNWDVQHTHSFIVNLLLASENLQGSPLISKFNFLRQNLSWREVKQFLHTLKYIRELASYFQVGILQANIIIFEIILLRFLNYEGHFLKNTTLDFQERDIEQSRISLDQNCEIQNDKDLKEESFQKFIELRMEEKLEEYIQVLHQIQKYDEAKKLLIYSYAHSKTEEVQFWLSEIQQGFKRKRVSYGKVIEKNISQMKYIIHEINVLRIENSKIASFQPDYQYDQIKKIQYRDVMKEADEIEKEIESYDRNSVSSQNKQILKLDYIVLSLRMHIFCAQYIRYSNQSQFSTLLMEKAFKKLTSICFEKAVGNLSDIYENYSIQQGGCQMYHAAAKTQQEINAQQSQIGFIINPFTKIQTLVNNRKYSSNNKILGDLVEYLNIGNGFSYFKNTGSKRIQQMLIQCLKIYCKNQNSLNCFNNLKYYGKLLQVSSIRFLVLHEFLRIQTILKDYSDFLRNGVVIDIIGNLLLQKQYTLQTLHNLFSKRKSSVINMQLSSFIQSLNEKLLTQDLALRTTKMYKMSMQYMISLFTSSVRINHKNLESEICEMIFFSRKKFQYLNPKYRQNLSKNSSEMERSESLETNNRKKILSKSQNKIIEQKTNLGSDICDLFYNILSIDKNNSKQSSYLIVNEDFCSHIISHKNYYSFSLRYTTLIQSLNLLNKITDCRLSMSENSNLNKIPTVLCDEIDGNFIALINFRQLCQLLHNSYLQYDLTYAKQFFYLYHKFDETIKELLRETPSLIQVYQNNTIVKSCNCLAPNKVKTPLFLDGCKQLIVESFSLDASYMYKSMLVNSQDLSQSQEAILLDQENFEEQNSSMKQSQSDQNFQSEQQLKNPYVKQIANQIQDEIDGTNKFKQLGYIEKLNSLNSIQQAQINFEFKRLRTSMRDFSISKYSKSELTQVLEKSFKCSKIDNFAQRHYQFQQIKLEHDLIILNFIDYNNERVIQITKFNHLNQNYSNFRINSQSQTNLFSDYINDIKRILQNNESDMRNDEKKRKSQVDPNNWWKSRHSNDKQLEKILSQSQTILDYHIFLFFGSEDIERERKIIQNVLDKLNYYEQESLDNQSQDKSKLFEKHALIQEKNNLIELLFSLIKCSLFITLNQTKSKLIFELMCIQNIFLQYLGIQSQQMLFADLCKMQNEYKKGYNTTIKKPVMWILSENLLQAPLEFMNCFSDNNQTFYRIPSVQYLIENYTPYNCVNFSNNYYLLNPSGDLVHTQSKFQQKFESIRSWEGASGFSVSTKELQKVLKNYQSYTYIGHGAGELYINQKQIQEIKNIKSAILLFGCQSAKQVVQLDFNSHQYEITGNSLYFLMNKCKVLIGSLWDVTDRDTDRMVLKLIQVIEKATFKKPIEFSQAFLQSREECKLKWLNGSSFVIYGIPSQFYMK